MAPGEVATRIYFANFDEFEFQFTTSADAVEISAWGKNAAGELVVAHRLVPAELDLIGPNEAAFRAVNNTAEQNVTADTLVVPVLYPDELFDLNNEYDPVASTFTPKQDGVYSIIASVNFGPVVDGVIVPTNYRVLIVIRINGNPVVADNDFFGEIPIGSGITVSAILQLTAGDEVNVAAISSTNGVFFANPLGMHFEAARLPSPLINDPSTGITSSSNILSSGEL